VAVLMRLQSDEENAVRGYASTRDPAFRTKYHETVTEFPVDATTVAQRLSSIGADPRAITALQNALERNARWRREIAEPTFRDAQRHAADNRDGAYLEEMHSDMEIVSGVLVDNYHRFLRQRNARVRLAAIIGFGAIVVVALQVLAYAFLVDRLRGELRRERRVVTLLQTAFASEIVDDPRLDIAASYVSATRGAKVGGDVYDIFPIDSLRTLVVIADVSGKGVEAAVDSTFVKYSLRAFAFEHADAATVVTKFNRLYARSQKAPEAFVVLFAGIIDSGLGTLEYVNAGHEAAYIRRPQAIEQLTPTGPIIGIITDADFASSTTSLTSDDLLFLSTDGLTEARDPSGNFLTGAGLEAWLHDADASTARSLIEELARRLRRYTRDRSNDDLAILALRPR
jgi:serine phosphatase RsbU (regulator of sigma subunit)